LREIIDKSIEEGNLKIKQSRLELEKFKTKFMERKNIIKEEFTDKIKDSQTTRETCHMFLKFNNIPGITIKVACDEIKENDRVL
jgi:hypothetical protein